ncbi:Uncharacterised protein [Mycobacteroides abscessus subsp. abscessus]|nr:Uncharacterised protein [Mycobacteroides abscessus subsp. abscessus]
MPFTKALRPSRLSTQVRHVSGVDNGVSERYWTVRYAVRVTPLIASADAMPPRSSNATPT